MENIKDLTPAQMMKLVETWCSVQDNRHFIGSIGVRNDEGIDASSAVFGNGEELSIMLENLLDTEKDLTIAAMERTLIKRGIEPDIEGPKLKKSKYNS